jgi:hypothetical protein
MMIASAPIVQLPEVDWLARQSAHEQRVRVWTDPHQARQAKDAKHPVEDFLFEYYRYRASWLRRWHPGPDVMLLGAAARAYLQWPQYHEVKGGPGSDPVEGVMLNPATFAPQRRDSLAWMLALLRNTAERPPQFACYGLHEWAMVYRQTADEVRHNQWPLRFPPDELARIVETQPVRCSHFDAFRFFTTPARSLNKLQPDRATSAQYEQRGCLHANMDLYKWAFKLAPFAPSALIADCFAFARDIREVDMRASPYDLRALGYTPIAIETPEGRGEYERHQRAFAERGQPLRTRLITLGERLLAG